MLIYIYGNTLHYKCKSNVQMSNEKLKQKVLKLNFTIILNNTIGKIPNMMREEHIEQMAQILF